jgi:hypothetical protein
LKIISNANFVTDIVESKTSVHKDHDQHSDGQVCVLLLLVWLLLVFMKRIRKHLPRNTRTMSAISEQQLLKFTKFRTKRHQTSAPKSPQSHMHVVAV